MMEASLSEEGRTRLLNALKKMSDSLDFIIKKLDLISKTMWYFSAIIVVPLLFILAKFGLDIKQYFYGPELSASQREIVLSLTNRGYEATEKGALSALKDGSPIFVEYLSAGFRPDPAAASSLLSELAISGRTLSGDIEILKGWFRRDPVVSKSLRPLLEDANLFITDISNNVTFDDTSQVCSALGRNLQNGTFGYAISNTTDCQTSFIEGTFGVYLINLITNTRYWNDLLGIAQPPKVPNENVVKIATLADVKGKATGRPLTPITPELFDGALDGSIYRFKVDAYENGTLDQIEHENSYRLAVVNQDSKIKKKEVFKIRLFREYTDEWYYKYCNQGESCLIEFNAIFFEKRIYLTKIISSGIGDNELWAYIDSLDDWSDSR